MRVSILQPSYVPWRGYFDQIRRVDLFIFYDDVQYDKRGWRNRNRIKTAQGVRWLTAPIDKQRSDWLLSQTLMVDDAVLNDEGALANPFQGEHNWAQGKTDGLEDLGFEDSPFEIELERGAARSAGESPLTGTPRSAGDPC